ncbi:DUF2334 domain-containing protein [Aquabacterium fontiphilum]|nr:DUF2334 domain-containing protein [Aquabacterium fontiphilum]
MTAPALMSIVIHDVAPVNWAACQRVMRAVREIGNVPMTLLAVPRFHLRPSTPEFEHAVSTELEHGCEVALHGYTHLDAGHPRHWRDWIRRRIYTRGEGEFSDLGQWEASMAIDAGIRWFQRCRWPLHGFVAPAWLLSPGAWSALSKKPLRYTCTRRALYTLDRQGRYPADSLVYSTESSLRRSLSLTRHAYLSHRIRQQSLVRLELHPHDADHPAIRRAWMRTLSTLLPDREVCTLADAVTQLAHAAERSSVFPETDPITCMDIRRPM